MATALSPRLPGPARAPRPGGPQAAVPPRLRSGSRTLVMGILNVTPDSFSDGGAWLDPGAAASRAEAMAAQGADLIDIGGESTRPGSLRVPLDEELRRVMPVVRRLARRLSIPLSIDTTKAEVARHALDAGGAVVNDISALRADPRMAGVIADRRAAVILMHIRGAPETMQRRPRYRDVTAEVIRFLEEAARRAREAGIARSRILIDPGIGFGKTLAHNLRLMANLDRFTRLGFPVVLGASRKSFIGAVLSAPVHDRLAGTLACVARAHACGVRIVRVHDVEPAAQLLRMLNAIDDEAAGHPGRQTTRQHTAHRTMRREAVC